MSIESPPDLARTVPLTDFERRFRHPPGLVILFFAEMWERFSYYGMRGLLKLYMVNYLFITLRQSHQGGAYDLQGQPSEVIGWNFIKTLLPVVNASKVHECMDTKILALTHGDAAHHLAPISHDLALRIATETCAIQPSASVLYGTYTGLVYLTPLFGGIIADRLLGQRRTVVIGGLLMAAGHFVMAFQNQFFIALSLIILGNGAFKPNVSTQVGGLYPAGDPRRDGAYTIYYMGINLGAFICNLVCGTLAALYGWHFGFAAAGVGMLLGLSVYLYGQRYLAQDNLSKARASSSGSVRQPLTREEWGRVGALIALCALNVVFWAVYEQQGNTMQTWADEQTRWPVVLGFQVPSTWFQSVNPLCIVAIAPLLDLFWGWQNRKGKEPTSVSKMAIGCTILGLSFIVMIVGATVVGNDKGSLFWPIFCTLLLTVGELYVSPIGLSLVTKVAPVRIVSMMMGIWFLSSFLGNFLSGQIGVLYTTWTRVQFFTFLMTLGVGAGAAMWAFNKPLRRAVGQA